ncbi:SMI1/KNR4 family protein [Streptomyces sp. NPDC050738]|uniref:SMI1/KNR4 family protein n=1 Tax=Streptomyces sp. NPDC050738 TaxID=3154744 RepID=UPI0034233B77
MQYFEIAGDRYGGPSLDDSLIARAEEVLGVKFPDSYLNVLREKNGGCLRLGCFPTNVSTTWAPDHISLDVLFGIGGEFGIDAVSAELVEEWGYPNIGIVIGITPAAGPDTVMLDYSTCGPSGEPSVVYVEDDREPKLLASDFATFLNGLLPHSEYDNDVD